MAYLAGMTNRLGRVEDGNTVSDYDKEEIKETIEYMSRYSLYAYENELRRGFLTLEGGHRVELQEK